ncbi:PulJ/GspJ family protein [Acetivibrio mesophilus]|uniref:Type II secretion system protein n=1 Tax=Acetivibrio mesophilus TaxID=2487273 RepID=A0A4V1K2D8_9FIRM|nr:type II secretion system protein [Acetivibrio mesophilus]ODM25059.1 prepilin-type N-terminal cleavage/methylation domain-containing protein [Clostridium sp. Bc-iso-3]RXE59939.1 type II secretion system protein [Acetivibrio mesophilus]HHV29476.1 type II secretion system protein [Clostridium sp.]
MLKNNCKGTTLVEMLVVIAIMGITAPIIYTIFIGGLNDFARGCNFIDQQHDIQDVIRQVRHDVQDAKTVEVWTTGEVAAKGEKKLSSVSFTMNLPEETEKKREWKFEDDSLQLRTINAGVPGEFIKAVDDVDISKSYFEYYEDGDVKQLILHIMPKQNDRILNKAGNVQEEIITEYSVRYKTIEVH